MLPVSVNPIATFVLLLLILLLFALLVAYEDVVRGIEQTGGRACFGGGFGPYNALLHFNNKTHFFIVIKQLSKHGTEFV
jgi:hypothetical protein